MSDIALLMKHNQGGELNPIQTEEALLSVIRSHVYTDVYVAPQLQISAQMQFEADTRQNKIIRKEIV